MPHGVAYERWKARETLNPRKEIGHTEVYPGSAPLDRGNDLLLLGIVELKTITGVTGGGVLTRARWCYGA
jgi:hypothetical protein